MNHLDLELYSGKLEKGTLSLSTTKKVILFLGTETSFALRSSVIPFSFVDV